MAVLIDRKVRQYQNLERHDDIRLLDSWIEFTDKDCCDFLVYKLKFRDDESGEWEEVYKAVRFLRLLGVPREIREEETHMDIFADVLSALWASDVDLVHVIARVKEPVERVLFLYGVQGVAYDLDEAKAIAREGFASMKASLKGSVPQIRLEQLSATDAEILRQKMYEMKHIQMIRGIPKARRSAAGSSQSSIIGHLSITDAEQQIEELVRGIEDEFVMITVASPVPFPALNDWLHNYTREQSIWASEKEGVKGISVGLGMPIVLGGNVGMGENTGTSVTEGVSETTGTSVTETTGVSEGVGYTESETRTVGENIGYSETVGKSYGVSIGESESYSQQWSRSETHTIGTGVTLTETFSETHSDSTSETIGTSISESWGQNESWSTSRGWSESSASSESISSGNTYTQGESDTATSGGSITRNVGSSYQHGTGSSYAENINSTRSWSLNSGVGGQSSENQNMGLGSNRSEGSSGGFRVRDVISFDANIGSGGSFNTGWGWGGGENWSLGSSKSFSMGEGFSISNSNSYSESFTEGMSEGETWSHSQGASRSWSQSESRSNSFGYTYGTSGSEGHSTGTSYSRSVSDSISHGRSIGLSRGTSIGTSTSTSQSVSRGFSYGESVSRGITRTESVSDSISRSQSYGQSTSHSVGEASSYSRSVTDSEARAYSRNKGESISRGYSQGLSHSRGINASMTFGPSISASKSVQWKRMDIESLVELIELQRIRLMAMIRSGAWYVDVYLLTGDIETKEQAATLARAAFWATDAPQPVQIIEPPSEWAEHLKLHATCFSACTAKEDTPGIMEAYKFSTILLPEELAAYTHLPRGEFGGVITVAERIPLFAVPETTGNIYMGRVVSPETGEVTNIPYNFNEKSLMHTLIAGASGTGKTVSSIRYVYSILQNVDCGAVILDWKMDWRALLQYLPPERCRFYGLDASSRIPIKMNLLEPPEYISPTTWRDKVIESMCLAFGLGSKQYGILYKHITELFYEHDVIRFVGFRRDGGTRVLEKNYETDQETGYRSIKIPENGYPEVHPDWRKNIKKVTLATLYMRLREVREVGLDRNSRGLADTYDSLLTRLEYYVSGDLRRLYASEDEDTVKISDFVHGNMVTVLEGGNLDSLNKIFIINVFMQGLFAYCKEKFRRNGNKVDNEILVVLEEAHNVIPGDAKGHSDTALPITESVWEIAFNEARGYGMYLVAILQVPSRIPTNITANCSNLIIHRLGNEDDTRVVTTLLVRDSQRDHRDIPRFLTRLPVGMAVVKQSRVRNLWEMEPAVIAVDHLVTDTPSDDVLENFLMPGKKA